MLYFSTQGSFSPVNMHPLGPRAGELTKRSDCHETGESRRNCKQQQTQRGDTKTRASSFCFQLPAVLSYYGKNKITAEADCITGNPLLPKRQGIGTSILQALLWGRPGSAGDRLHLVAWLEIENTKHSVKAVEQSQEAVRCALAKAPFMCSAVALWGLPSLCSGLAAFLSSICSQKKSSRSIVRKKLLSLENLIKYRDIKNRPEKKEKNEQRR